MESTATLALYDPRDHYNSPDESDPFKAPLIRDFDGDDYDFALIYLTTFKDKIHAVKNEKAKYLLARVLDEGISTLKLEKK